MLRTTPPAHGWKMRNIIARVQPALRGRARFETKFASVQTMGILKHETQRRNGKYVWYQRAETRLNIGAALREHNTDLRHFENDSYRQNVFLNPGVTRLVALQEPMAFRSLVELTASAIPPPPPPEAIQRGPALPDEGPENTDVDLRRDVERMLEAKSPLAEQFNADQLMDAWKDYVLEEEGGSMVAPAGGAAASP